MVLAHHKRLATTSSGHRKPAFGGEKWPTQCITTLTRKNKGYPLFLQHRAARRAFWDELFFRHQMGSYHRMLVLLARDKATNLGALSCDKLHLRLRLVVGCYLVCSGIGHRFVPNHHRLTSLIPLRANLDSTRSKATGVAGYNGRADTAAPKSVVEPKRE